MPEKKKEKKNPYALTPGHSALKLAPNLNLTQMYLSDQQNLNYIQNSRESEKCFALLFCLGVGICLASGFHILEGGRVEIHKLAKTHSLP